MNNINKTYTAKPSEIKKEWHKIDASNEVLGRLASKIAMIIMGKTKPTFTASMDTGDRVVVLNAAKIRVTGNKETDKVYYKHSGYPGGMRSETYKEKMQKNPTTALREAVFGMLPKNKLRKKRIKNLFIYAKESHPHGANIDSKAVESDK